MCAGSKRGAAHGDVRLLGGRAEPARDAGRVEVVTAAAGEHERIVRRAESLLPRLPQPPRRLGREGDASTSSGALGCPVRSSRSKSEPGRAPPTSRVERRLARVRRCGFGGRGSIRESSCDPTLNRVWPPPGELKHAALELRSVGAAATGRRSVLILSLLLASCRVGVAGHRDPLVERPAGGKSHGKIATILPSSEGRDVSTFGILKLTLDSASYSWSAAAIT